MIRPGDPLDADRRRRIVALIAAVIGTGPASDQLAQERLASLAPGEVVTEALASYVGRVMALATRRCVVCLEPGRMHPDCAVRHAVELAAAIGQGARIAPRSARRRR